MSVKIIVPGETEKVITPVATPLTLANAFAWALEAGGHRNGCTLIGKPVLTDQNVGILKVRAGERRLKITITYDSD